MASRACASSCGSTDLAVNRPATASSTESGAFPASAAVDGGPGTRWSSQLSDPQWVQVDLCGPPPPNWNLVWQDTFTGAAGTAPASANWIEDTGHNSPGGPANWGTGEVESASASTANVSVDGNGHLNITALEDSAGNWTSGRIETQRSDFAAPAGGMLKVTATIKQPNVPNPTGYWPAFRALGNASRTGTGTWPG